MAHIANRSASPNPSRSQSPSPRVANASKPAKKIPWVNPTAPKNTVFSSPSDIPQRNSGSRGGGLGASSVRVSFEHNENDGDLNRLKLNKARSPAAAPSKGTKNFMSPTISACSKVTAASPKRRVLSERNDGTRLSLTSVSDSFSLMESERTGAKLEMDIGPRVPLDTPKAMKVLPERVESEGTGSKPLESFNLGESLSSFDKRNHDPELTEHNPSVSVTCCSPVIASLDEQPAVPPYDPKTNYLSPRPRFLHYRPKPRIEHYLNEGEGLFGPGDGGQLEDKFSSESSEEASEQTEEVQSSDERNACEGDYLSSEVENGEVGEEAHDPEPKPVDAMLSKETPRSHFFTRSKFTKFFLLMVVASLFVSVIDTPNTGISSFSALKHESVRNLHASVLQIFDDPHLRDSFNGLKEHANLNFDKLAHRVRDWSISSVAHFQMLIANFAVPREEIGFFFVNNITAKEAYRIEELEGDEMEQEVQIAITDVSDVSLIEKTAIEAAELEQESSFSAEQEVLDSIKDGTEDGSEAAMGHLEHRSEGIEDEIKELKTAIEAAELEQEASFSAELEVLDSIKDGMEDGSEAAMGHLEHRSEGIEDEIKTEGQAQFSLDNSLSSIALVQPSGEETGSDLDFQPMEVSDEVEEEPHAQVDYENVLPQTDVEEDYGGSQEPQTFHHPNFGPGADFPLQTLLGVSSVILALAALIVSLCVKQKHMSAAAHEPSSHNKVISDPMRQKCMQFQSPIQSHLPEAETMVGESGPWEVSSSLLSFSQKRSRRGVEQDTFSHERDLRRDSVASSTSYGSFTTYERLSAKKGCRDDDELTPVRRSSRIRNQVTSP